jgi:hypothetical protein
MKEQTAVEWLFEQLWNEPMASEWLFKNLWNKKDKSQNWYEKFEKAKAMEKDQIIAAHGRKTTITDVNGTNLYGIKTGQEYYTETYGK